MNSFIKQYFFSVFLIFSLLMGFIISIDPYDKLGINVWGFNTKAVARARENKFNMVENTKKTYNAFLLGSSSAHRFQTKTINKLTGLNAFNYAVQHTTPEDYLAITRHILSRFKPKLILLQLDFYALNKYFEIDPRFYASPLYEYLNLSKKQNYFEGSLFDNNYLTLEALRDSFRVVGVNLFGKALHVYEKNGNYRKEKRKIGLVQISQFSGGDYEFSTIRISYLKEIVKLCRNNQVKLVVWLGPKSIEHYRKIQKNKKLALKLTEYKDIARGLFKNFYDFTNNNMENYNTTEFFMDSSHPTPRLSDIILEKVLKNYIE